MDRDASFVPAGYMAKLPPTDDPYPRRFPAAISSVSGCVVPNFADYVEAWLHNDHWFFDSIARLREAARRLAADLGTARFVYYEQLTHEFDTETRTWNRFPASISSRPGDSTPRANDYGPNRVEVPRRRELLGFDVVTSRAGNGPECSPLTCNDLASSLPVNGYCLFDSFEEAARSVEDGGFEKGEAGPYRFIAVYRVDPDNLE